MYVSPRRLTLGVICFGSLGAGFGLALGAVLGHEIGRGWVMLIALPFVIAVIWSAGKIEALNQEETEERIKRRVEYRYKI